MKKLFLIIPFILYAGEQQTPKALEWENVLKQAQVKNEVLPALPPLVNGIEQEGTKDFNLVGIISIKNKKYAYLLTPDNKTIKVVSGLYISGKKIEEIEENGIFISDKAGKKSFLPIIEKQIEEKDIEFSNKQIKETK